MLLAHRLVKPLGLLARGMKGAVVLVSGKLWYDGNAWIKLHMWGKLLAPKGSKYSFDLPRSGYENSGIVVVFVVSRWLIPPCSRNAMLPSLPAAVSCGLHDRCDSGAWGLGFVSLAVEQKNEES